MIIASLALLIRVMKKEYGLLISLKSMAISKKMRILKIDWLLSIIILKKNGAIQSLHDYSIENGFGMAASKNSKYYLFYPEGSIEFTH
jgi:hypothetical protein